MPFVISITGALIGGLVLSILFRRMGVTGSAPPDRDIAGQSGYHWHSQKLVGTGAQGGVLAKIARPLHVWFNLMVKKGAAESAGIIRAAARP